MFLPLVLFYFLVPRAVVGGGGGGWGVISVFVTYWVSGSITRRFTMI